MESLYVVVPGFGSPQWDLKVGILKNNIRVIESHRWQKWKMVICQYQQDMELPEDISRHPCVTVIKEPGIVGEYLVKHTDPDTIIKEGYTHMMAILDDVELVQKTFSWHLVFKYLDDLKADILSPSMTEDSAFEFQYMLTKPKAMFGLKLTPCCEFFCYIMPVASYKKYYENALDINNPWMWGIDMILKIKHNLQPVIANTICMRHYIKGTSYQQHPDKDPIHARTLYLEKHGLSMSQVSCQPSEMYYVIPV